VCASETPSADLQPGQRDSTRAAVTPLPREARRELALLFATFACLRLMSLWWFRPLYSEAGGFFFPFAYLQSCGYYPFLDYWLEYPPILAYVMVGLRGLALWVAGPGSVAWERAAFVRTVQVSSVVWETASLALIYAMARFLRGPRAAARACWFYVALFATAFVALSYVDSFPVFLMLCGVVLAVYSRTLWAALALAAGFMTKVFPIGILPTVLKSDGRWRWRAAMVGLFLLFAAYFAAPFLATGRQWLWCWAESSLRRPPWQTVWALLDGRYEFGYVGPLDEDQNPEFYKPEKFGVAPGIRGTLESVPAEVYWPPHVRRTIRYRVASRFATRLTFIDSRPRSGAGWWWIYGGAGVVVAALYVLTFALLPAALRPRQRLLFAAFSMFVLFFYLKGWSPQFVAYLIPFLLIVFPPGEGAIWSLLLTVTAFVEMPLWAAYVHPLAAMGRLLLQLAVGARTIIFVLVIARLFRRLFRD